MAAVKKGRSKFATMMRVSPLKPGLRGSQNWMAAKVRAAKHSPRAMVRFMVRMIATFFVIIFIALWLGGFLPAMSAKLDTWKVERLMAMGFVVEQVDVMGEGRLSERDIRAAVQIHQGSYFFGVDLETTRDRVESLPWVDRAVVRRLWPNRIVVQVVETKPYALWQNDGELYLLSDAGKSIVPVSQAKSVPQNLKTYIGEAAPASLIEIEAALKPYDDIWERVENLVKFPSGRWDLHMKHDILVRLPTKNVEQALDHLAKLDRETFILSRQIGVIDLRLEDRIGLIEKPTLEAQSS